MQHRKNKEVEYFRGKLTVQLGMNFKPRYICCYTVNLRVSPSKTYDLGTTIFTFALVVVVTAFDHPGRPHKADHRHYTMA